MNARALTLGLFLAATAVTHADYSTVVLADGPLAYYRFEEGAGATTTNDSSGNDLHATDITNGVFGNAGAIGNAVRFDQDGSILTPLTLDPSLGDFSIEALVNPAFIPVNSGVFVSNQDGALGTGRSSLLIQMNSGGINSFVGGATTTSGVEAQLGVWYHVILTYDSSAVAGGIDPTIRFYIDGVEAGNSNLVAESADGNWILGAHKSRISQWYRGLLDEVAIYDKRLDDPDGDGDTADSRIADHYNAYLAADVIKSFTSDMASIPSGSSATLSWETSDPMALLTLDDGTGPVDVLPGLVDEMGSMVVSPTEDTTYTLTGTGGAAGCTEIARVTILVDPVPVINSFTASATDVSEGASVDLSWSITDATGASIDNGVGAVNAVTGTQSVVVNATTTYILTATNDNGSVTAEVTVNAAPLGLVAHWRVGEAPGEQAGTVLVAEQGAGFDGTFVGTPVFDATDPAPVPDGSSASIVFDGAGSYVDVLGYTGIGGSQARTVAFWFKGPAEQTNNHGTLVSWGTGATGMRYDVRVKNNPLGFLRTEVSGSGSDGTALIADDAWHHCAVVLDPNIGGNIGDVLFYVDGQPDTISAPGTTDVNSSLANNVRIGASRALANRSLTGKMDDIRIYNVALGADEILALFESQAELSIDSIDVLANGDVEVRWSGPPGDYSVEYSFDMRAGSWLELNDPSIPAGESSAVTLDIAADAVGNQAGIERIYYRILSVE